MKSLIALSAAALLLCCPAVTPHTHQAETVRITHPTREITIPYNTEILFAVELSPRSSVATVDFLVNAKKLAARIAPPYRISFVPRSQSSVLSARVRSADGRVIESMPILLHMEPPPSYPEPSDTEMPVGGVLRDLQFPQVQILEPSVIRPFFAPATVRLAVDAKEPGGRIARVDFFEGSRLLGSAFNEPWILIWERAPAGDHLISVAAVDDHGRIARTRHVLIGVD